MSIALRMALPVVLALALGLVGVRAGDDGLGELICCCCLLICNDACCTALGKIECPKIECPNIDCSDIKCPTLDCSSCCPENADCCNLGKLCSGDDDTKCCSSVCASQDDDPNLNDTWCCLIGSVDEDAPDSPVLPRNDSGSGRHGDTTVIIIDNDTSRRDDHHTGHCSHRSRGCFDFLKRRRDTIHQRPSHAPMAAPPTQHMTYPPASCPPPTHGNYPPPTHGNYPPPTHGNYPPPVHGNYPPPAPVMGYPPMYAPPRAQYMQHPPPVVCPPATAPIRRRPHRVRKYRLKRGACYGLLCGFTAVLALGAIGGGLGGTLPNMGLKPGYNTPCADLQTQRTRTTGDFVDRAWFQYWAQYDAGLGQLTVNDNDQRLQEKFLIDDGHDTTHVQTQKSGVVTELGTVPWGSTIAAYPTAVSATLNGTKYDLKVSSVDQMQVTVAGNGYAAQLRHRTKIFTSFNVWEVIDAKQNQFGSVLFAKGNNKMKICVQESVNGVEDAWDKEKRQIAFLIADTARLKLKATPKNGTNKQKID